MLAGGARKFYKVFHRLSLGRAIIFPLQIILFSVFYFSQIYFCIIIICFAFYFFFRSLALMQESNSEAFLQVGEFLLQANGNILGGLYLENVFKCVSELQKKHQEKSDRQKINRITFDLFLKIFVLHGVKKTVLMFV